MKRRKDYNYTAFNYKPDAEIGALVVGYKSKVRKCVECNKRLPKHRWFRHKKCSRADNHAYPGEIIYS